VQYVLTLLPWCIHKTGKLEEFVVAYEVPIGRMVQEKIPTGSGKKDNEKSMKRKRTEHARRDVSLYGERVEASSSKSSNNGSDCQYKVTQCYGCKGEYVRNHHRQHHIHRMTYSYGTWKGEFSIGGVRQKR
jgi:hypothetical protein